MLGHWLPSKQVRFISVFITSYYTFEYFLLLSFCTTVEEGCPWDSWKRTSKKVIISNRQLLHKNICQVLLKTVISGERKLLCNPCSLEILWELLWLQHLLSLNRFQGITFTLEMKQFISNALNVLFACSYVSSQYNVIISLKYFIP